MSQAPREARVQTVCLVVLTTLAVGAALWWLRPVLVPFVLAIFVTLGLSPLVTLQMQRFRAPRAVALGGTLVVAVLVLAVLWGIVSASVRELSANADTYHAALQSLVERADRALRPERANDAPSTQPGILSGIPIANVRRAVLSTTSALMELLSDGVLVLIFVCFLLVGRARAAARPGVWGEIEAQVQRYILIKTLLSGLTGALVGAALWLVGVDFALVFGLFAFLLNFIPNLGSIVATLLPVPVILATPDATVLTVALAIALPTLVQGVIGYIIDPRVMGNSFDLHPVAVLLTLVFWGMLWGVVGMILATPITASLKIALERHASTRPLAALLAGRLDGVVARRER